MIKEIKDCPPGSIRSGKIYKFKSYNSEYTRNVVVIRSPFANCQLYSIGNAHEILKSENPIKLFYKISKTLGKKLALIDINEYYIKDFKRIFRKGIISTKRYKSTNNSKMCIIIIKNVWS